MLLWNWKPRNGAGTAIYTWGDVATGVYDAKIDATADHVAAWAVAHPGKKTFMAFHHEPEDDVGAYGTAADYVAAYRRVHERFLARGATGVTWVWIMAGYKGRADEWNDLYPGDAYVDWLAYYDPYAGLCGDGDAPVPWATAVGEGYGPLPDGTGNYRFYKWATGAGATNLSNGNVHMKVGAHDKPILWGEYATKTGDGGSDGDRATFCRDMRQAIVDGGQFPAGQGLPPLAEGRRLPRLHVGSATDTGSLPRAHPHALLLRAKTYGATRQE